LGTARAWLIYTRFQHGIVCLGIEADPERTRCGGCGSTDVHKADTIVAPGFWAAVLA
jgi:hypothetical protein